MKYSLVLLVSFFSLVAFSQESINTSKFELKEAEGNFFFYWGYNRSAYLNSDIKLIGPGYNFTLSDVEASDLPKKFSSIYYDPTKFTIPQFNFRVGYFINDKYAIAAGWDHMKYKTVNGSTAKISGNIDSSASVLYAGNYNGGPITMNQYNLVKMEHSDGYNVINLNLERHDYLWNNKKESFAIKLVTGAGLGIAMPWTNSFILGKSNDDRPHFSGMGAQLFIAPEFVFFKRIFARSTFQGGFTKLWDIATTPKSEKSSTHAEQTIWYGTRSIVLGYRMKIFKPNAQ